jgi:hypothetical protein
MALTSPDPARLYQLLLNTGLQTKDNPLHQVLHDLIGHLVTSNKQITVLSGVISGSGGGSVGPQGPQGIQGLQGLAGEDGNIEDVIFHPLSINDLISLFTQGSIIFVGPSGILAQDNVKLFWDDINFRLGIGTNAPVFALTIDGTGVAGGSAGLRIRQSGANRYRSDLRMFGQTAVWNAFDDTGGVYLPVEIDGNPLQINTSSLGQVGIGLGGVAVTALLHLAAGTSAAKTAPFKLTSGPLLTVPEAGAIEFLTDAYYATITTGPTRHTFAFLESPAFTGVVSEENDGLIAVSTDGIVLKNETASTALVPVQISPRLRFRAHVWNTTAVAADNTDDWWIESIPVSSATPRGALSFKRSLNGGAAANPIIINHDAVNLSVALGIPGGQFQLVYAGMGYFGPIANGQFVLQNTAGTSGIGFDVNTNGVLIVRNKLHNADGAITYSSYTHSGAEIDKTYQIYTPLTGATVTMGAGQSRAIINPAGLIAALTVTLPPSPVDGQVAGFSFTQAVTVLTVNAPGGASVVASPTSAAIDTNLRFLYQASSTNWFPCS